MYMPGRLKRQAGRYALVDDIPFKLPVQSAQTPALMAAFAINADKAAQLLPGNELYPLRLWNRGLLVITVVNYEVTNIGKYIEFSIAIACTHGHRPAPRLLPALFSRIYGTGQYVYDLPVSTEVSVKGGKGIWGMPKHQANLDFVVGEQWVSSQYDLDGQLVMRIDVQRPRHAWMPVSMAGTNYCAFRGMLMASYIYFKGKLGFSLFKKGAARLVIGDHPRIQVLKFLEISPQPLFTGYFPDTHGVLDDHFDSWFLSHEQPPQTPMQGMESVVNLGQSQEWLSPPKRR
ncbi:MAG: acetoacetate decarboxylase family protein [Gammaproteobacteria bacterium]